MAGSWQPVAGGESVRDRLYPMKHGDLLESEIPDAALVLRYPVIQTRHRTAEMATRPTRR